MWGSPRPYTPTPPAHTFQNVQIYTTHPTHTRPVARGGGSGGSYDPPPVAHPKDFVPPFSNFVPPFSNFVPPFSNFVPPLEYVDDVTRAMSKGGGGACECPRVGAFFKLMTSRGQCPRGGGVRLVFHPSKFRPPPHLAGWLRACTHTHTFPAIYPDPGPWVGPKPITSGSQSLMPPPPHFLNSSGATRLCQML